MRAFVPKPTAAFRPAPAERRARTAAVRPPDVRLAMSRSGDASEQEAQRASEQVMRIPRLGPAQGFSPIPLHPADARNAASVTDTLPLANVLAADGHPLDADTRAFMEPRFQKDFSHVRLHSDARAGASARAVQARATRDVLLVAPKRFLGDLLASLPKSTAERVTARVPKDLTAIEPHELAQRLRDALADNHDQR